MQLKTRRIVTPITLLLLIGLLGYGAWWGWNQVTAPLPGNEPTPCVSTPAKKLSAKEVGVRVYNGGYKTGLASAVATELERKGFKTLAVGNSDKRRIKETIIIGKAKDDPEVKLVAGFFKKAVIEADNRVDGTVDVFVGSKYAGFNYKAPTSVPVPGGTACLPVLPSASPSASATGGASPAPETKAPEKPSATPSKQR